MTDSAARRPVRGPALAIVFFALSGVGLVGTWAFNIRFFAGGGTDYLGGWFANDAGSSAAVDLLVMAAAGSILMLVEGARLGWSKWVWVLVPLSLLIAVAFTFPLFLGLRELALRRRATGVAVSAGVEPSPR